MSVDYTQYLNNTLTIYSYMKKRNKIVEGYSSTMKTKKIDENDELVKTIREFLKTIKKVPVEVERNPNLDNISGQFSLNIPKQISLNTNITKDSKFLIVLNPNRLNLENMKKSKLIIYLKDEN